MTPNEIRQWRESHNMARSDLATWLDIPYITLRQWEKGTRRPSQLLPLALEALANRLAQKSA